MSLKSLNILEISGNAFTNRTRVLALATNNHAECIKLLLVEIQEQDKRISKLMEKVEELTNNSGLGAAE